MRKSHKISIVEWWIGFDSLARMMYNVHTIRCCSWIYLLVVTLSRRIRNRLLYLFIYLSLYVLFIILLLFGFDGSTTFYVATNNVIFEQRNKSFFDLTDRIFNLVDWSKTMRNVRGPMPDVQNWIKSIKFHVSSMCSSCIMIDCHIINLSMNWHVYWLFVMGA